MYKPRGRILDNFDPPLPIQTLLLNSCYEVVWSFEQPPSPSLIQVVCIRPQKGCGVMCDVIDHAIMVGGWYNFGTWVIHNLFLGHIQISNFTLHAKNDPQI